ncbi:glycine cleavage system protein H [Humisphaera borealis]|uniref:Glycine cleavage system protein H n=2 Tax=Humisphaera borealis TaxID=2807512 RepID=A0A7M2X4Z4_9BACT|nr:glycine cleavage system protein H [Humisphaera borealis]
MECDPNPLSATPAPVSKTPFDPATVILYKRNRFQSRLPRKFLYTRSHFWLEELEPASDGKAPLYKVGFTRFATRMLGEIVEQGFEAKPGSAITVGQTLGWVEGFKALSDVYGVIDGTFEGANTTLNDDPSRIDKDPYYAGWLYLARGTPDPNSTAVDGYMQVLDATIDKMLG